jgi:hypothetical protein
MLEHESDNSECEEVNDVENEPDVEDLLADMLPLLLHNDLDT